MPTPPQSPLEEFLFNPVTRDLFNTLDVYAVQLDDRLRVTWASAGMASYHGTTQRDLLHLTAFDILPREEAEIVTHEDRTVLETGTPIVGRVHQITGVEDTHRVWLDKIRGGSGADTRVLIVQQTLGEDGPPPHVAAPLMTHPEACEQCGHRFRRRRSWQRFCSHDCRQLAFWQRRKRR